MDRPFACHVEANQVILRWRKEPVVHLLRQAAMSDSSTSAPVVGQEVWAAVSVIFCVAVILVFFFILCCAYRRHRRVRDINALSVSTLHPKRCSPLSETKRKNDNEPSASEAIRITTGL